MSSISCILTAVATAMATNVVAATMQLARRARPLAGTIGGSTIGSLGETIGGTCPVRHSSSARNVPAPEHLRKLQAMYRAAPISGLFNAHKLEFSDEGSTEIVLDAVETTHCHSAGTLHGSGYFKLLDDAAFFAAQSKVDSGFAFTTSFTVYMMRPCSPGTKLIAKGRVTSASRSLVVAESTLEDEVRLADAHYPHAHAPLSTLL